MCYRFSHRANFQRATYPSLPLTFSTGSPASHHTSWLSSPLCNLHCWELSHGRKFSPMSLRKPEEYENFFFSWTQWECVGYTLSTVFAFFLLPVSFFFFCHSCLVFLSFSKELRDGPNQNQSYLTISLLYFYLLEFYFNVRRCSEEKKIRMFDEQERVTIWVAFLLHLSFYWLSYSFLHERIIEAVALRWLKRHFNM